VDCEDSVGRAYRAYITDVRGDAVQVHYDGWPDKWDEWIDLSTHPYRIALFGSWIPDLEHTAKHCHGPVAGDQLGAGRIVGGARPAGDAIRPPVARAGRDAADPQPGTSLRSRIESLLCVNPLSALVAAAAVSLRIGRWIDCKDTVGHPLEAQVIARSGTNVQIHYDGWSAKWDEWLPQSSPRIAAYGTWTSRIPRDKLKGPGPKLGDDVGGGRKMD